MLNKLLPHFIAACHAVNYAHHRGVVHRDLKPSHILLGKHGETLVVDWGLARHVTREGRFKTELEESLGPSDDRNASSEQLLAGTPSYMCPELWQGSQRVLPSHDIYSLGVSLFKLVIGNLPYPCDSVASFRLLVLQKQLPTLDFGGRGLNRSLEAVIQKAMHVDPAQRYESAGDLAADLESLLGGFPVSAICESPKGGWQRIKQTLAELRKFTQFNLNRG